MEQTLVYLETICSQLKEALGLPDGLNVAALIDKDSGPHTPQGWCIVRLQEDGSINPVNSRRYETIRDLMDGWRQEKFKQPKQEWSEEDKDNLYAAINNLEYLKNNYVYHQMGLEPAITFLKSLKYRVLPQPQQEWSEEDEELLHDVSDTYFYNDEDYPEETYKQMLKRVLDWMNKRAKSLRPQKQWKPSEGQMEAICVAVRKMKESACYDSELVSLYNDLKKLKG